MIRKLILLIFIFSLSFTKTLQQNTKPNQLINEDSPYLLQHAYNPVNWMAWNKKSLLKAKKEDKLIFLSIGYSTCHWCHVMEEESFSKKELAKLFNKDYISIKVDRELMTTLDIHYQDIAKKITKSNGGWPLNVILTPNLDVLYITTYIPPTTQHDTLGLNKLLPKYVKIYKNKFELEQLITLNNTLQNTKIKYTPKNLENLQSKYINSFNPNATFPLSSNLSLLYDIYDLTKSEKAKKLLYERLENMAKSGLYDQIDGGFFRYSISTNLIVPHFEKMLYTTAQLLPIYARAYLDTNNTLYKKIVTQSIQMIENKLLKDGLFYSAIDASSDNKEGKYYVYDYKQTYDKLISNHYTHTQANDNLEYLDIYESGNFKDTLSNVHFLNNDEDTKKPAKLLQTINILKKMRHNRTFPFIDKKYLTSWNAMMIVAYFKASNINIKYKKQAFTYLDNLLNNLYINDTLYHYKIGKTKPSLEANLEDYSYTISVLLEAYENSYDKKYMKLATKLYHKALKKFYKNKTWYLSNSILKTKATLKDKYYTSALGLMFLNQITIANINYDLDLLFNTREMIKDYKNQILMNISNNPASLKAMIRLKKGDIILKSKTNNLLKQKDNIRQIKYPFLLTTFEDANEYLACDEKTCFSYDKDFNKIKQTIKKRVLQQ